jgi:hypothetical protein
MVTQCADRAKNTLVVGIAGRWICQQLSLLSPAVNIFIKNAYLKELLKTWILCFVSVLGVLIEW